jgi:uncharacterized protein GlcG (DUF336 family)
VADQIEIETPARLQQLALGRAAADVVDICVGKGMMTPLTVAMVGPNGVVIVVRTDRDARLINPVVEHYPEPLAAYPVTITVVDRNGEALAFRLSAEGTLSATRH